MKVFEVGYGIKLLKAKRAKEETIRNFGKVNVLVQDNDDIVQAIHLAKVRIYAEMPTLSNRRYEVLAESVSLVVENVL